MNINYGIYIKVEVERTEITADRYWIINKGNTHVISYVQDAGSKFEIINYTENNTDNSLYLIFDDEENPTSFRMAKDISYSYYEGYAYWAHSGPRISSALLVPTFEGDSTQRLGPVGVEWSTWNFFKAPDKVEFDKIGYITVDPVGDYIHYVGRGGVYLNSTGDIAALSFRNSSDTNIGSIVVYKYKVPTSDEWTAGVDTNRVYKVIKGKDTSQVNNKKYWTQYGQTINGVHTQGGGTSATNGIIICMNTTGNIIAFYNQQDILIYNFNGSNWQESGRITGFPSNTDTGLSDERQVQAIELNSIGNRIVIGYGRTNHPGAGKVSIYNNNNGTWQQIGEDIIGRHEDWIEMIPNPYQQLQMKNYLLHMKKFGEGH